MIRRLDSVVFDTRDLPAIRHFYGEVLGLAVGSFERDGRMVPDESASYVNFDVGGTLLGFETANTAQVGTVVFQVDGLPALLADFSAKGVTPVKTHQTFAIIRDPEGREVILQA